MRVVHLLQSDIFSGAENVVCKIIAMFQDDPEMEMIYVSPEGPQVRAALRERNIRYYALESFNRSEIDRAIRELRPDLIHAHDFQASVRASIYRDIRIFSHLHHNPDWLSRVCTKSVLYRLCVHRFEKILVVSKAIPREYVYRSALSGRTVCLPNVVDSAEVQKRAEEGEAKPCDLLFVGRLEPPKDPLRFLRIAAEVAKRYPGLSVNLVGSGSLEGACADYLREQQLSDKVRLSGYLENPYPAMAAARIILVPSEHEGFGLVAVEGMILGKVVLGTPVGGLKDILASGGGEVCATDEAFVERTLFYLEHAEECAALGEKARRSAKKYCNLERYKQKLEHLYRF